MLVGESSLVLFGSTRVTFANDIDIAVLSKTTFLEVVKLMKSNDDFVQIDGESYIKPAPGMEGMVKVDLVVSILGDKSYEDLISHTSLMDGFRVLNMAMSLGVKIKCWGQRPENEAGERKQHSDRKDALFLASLMQTHGVTVDAHSASSIKISHYDLLCFRTTLSERQVDMLIAVGVSGFLSPYDENASEHRFRAPLPSTACTTG